MFKLLAMDPLFKRSLERKDVRWMKTWGSAGVGMRGVGGRNLTSWTVPTASPALPVGTRGLWALRELPDDPGLPSLGTVSSNSDCQPGHPAVGEGGRGLGAPAESCSLLALLATSPPLQPQSLVALEAVMQGWRERSGTPLHVQVQGSAGWSKQAESAGVRGKDRRPSPSKVHPLTMEEKRCL